jgi:hypothetical protein
MLYWCGFAVIWKLDIALFAGLVIYLVYHRQTLLKTNSPLAWFMIYMGSLTLLSWLGAFGGMNILKFPLDLICFIPYSVFMLYLSQKCLIPASESDVFINNQELPILQ